MAAVLIMDLDGVLRLWDDHPVAQVEQDHALPRGSIQAVAFEPTLLRAAITGRISDEQWRSEVARRLSARHGSSAGEAVTQWSSSCGRIDAEVLALLRRQRRRWRVTLLTNATTRLRADLAVLRLTEEVDAVFSSAELGVAKPDLEAFRLVCTTLGVRPEVCAFVDDSPGNVHAAVTLGMTGHVYESPSDLGDFLDSLPLDEHRGSMSGAPPRERR